MNYSMELSHKTMNPKKIKYFRNQDRVALISKLTSIYTALTASDMQTGLSLVRNLLKEYHPEKPIPDSTIVNTITLRIYTLGRFSVVHKDKLIVFRGKAQKRPMDLLKAIIALGGRGVSKSLLTELLWPDSQGDAAASVINTTLSRLRKLIGKQSIVTENGRVSLNRMYCDVDCWELERLLNLGKKSQQPQKKTIDAIYKIYQGDFMSGEQDGWLIPKRNKLRYKLIMLLSSYGKLLIKSNDIKEACSIYETCIGLDHVREEFHMNLVRCQILLNQTSDAKFSYLRCERMLMSNLGIQPTTSYAKICESFSG